MSETQTIDGVPARALVLGLGASGCAAARLLARGGSAVTAVDRGAGAAGPDALQDLARQGVAVHCHTAGIPAGHYELCVVSPGIASRSEAVRDARQCCDDVIAELELAARFLQAPMVAITGTNGKSTAVKLCTEALQAAGLKALPGGNYGEPLSALVEDSRKAEWMVVEVSSFQLELMRDFHPRAALYLNLQADHLDRHGDMASYRRLKARLFDAMGSADTAMVQAAELAAVQACTVGSPRWMSFGAPGADVSVSPEWQVLQGGARCGVSLRDSYFANPVLADTAAAVTGVCLGLGVTAAAMEQAVQAFVPLPHRMQLVATLRGVDYIDDSKATNLAALNAALTMQDRPVRLIAGGRLKEKNLENLKEVLASRVRCVYVIGEAACVMRDAWSASVPVKDCGGMAEAVRAVKADVQAGEVVLLSPGCASFDQFTNYNVRGDIFRAMVEE